MAEGWAKALKSDLINAYSAGTEPIKLDGLAVQVMAEKGIDISRYLSKSVNELKDIHFDYVITVCDNAYENCPVFPGKTIIYHHGFSDPPRLAKDVKSIDEKLFHYRKVRDDIKTFIESIPEILIEQ